MKALAYFFAFIFTFLLVYITLSAIGLIITDLSMLEILRSLNWFSFYTVILGWQLPMAVCIEIRDYFDELEAKKEVNYHVQVARNIEYPKLYR